MRVQRHALRARSRVILSCLAADKRTGASVLTKTLTRFLRDTRGQDLIEYALIAAVVSLTSLAAINAVGQSLQAQFAAIGQRVNTSAAATAGSGAGAGSPPSNAGSDASGAGSGAPSAGGSSGNPGGGGSSTGRGNAGAGNSAGGNGRGRGN